MRRTLPADLAEIQRIHRSAFPTPAEARLVRSLIDEELATISLLSETAEGDPAGHILLSPVTIQDRPDAPRGLGLAPLAVLPSVQKKGHGSALAQRALEEACACGAVFVVVLGSPQYYGRFGFAPAHSFALRSIYTEGDEFMAIELAHGGLAGIHGLVRYASPFDALDE